MLLFLALELNGGGHATLVSVLIKRYMLLLHACRFAPPRAHGQYDSDNSQLLERDRPRRVFVKRAKGLLHLVVLFGHLLGECAVHTHGRFREGAVLGRSRSLMLLGNRDALHGEPFHDCARQGTRKASRGLSFESVESRLHSLPMRTQECKVCNDLNDRRGERACGRAGGRAGGASRRGYSKSSVVSSQLKLCSKDKMRVEKRKEEASWETRVRLHLRTTCQSRCNHANPAGALSATVSLFARGDGMNDAIESWGLGSGSGWKVGGLGWCSGWFRQRAGERSRECLQS